MFKTVPLILLAAGDIFLIGKTAYSHSGTYGIWAMIVFIVFVMFSCSRKRFQ